MSDHKKRYGKEAEDVKYGEMCQFCNSRVDEFGLCSCGASG